MTQSAIVAVLLFAAAVLYTSVGHGGASGRYDKLQEIAFDYAFMLDQWGIEK